MSKNIIFVILIILVGVYVVKLNKNKSTLESLSKIEVLSTEIMPSNVDNKRSCLFFNGAKRGFFNTIQANSKTVFSAKIAQQEAGPCIIEILADGQSFYKAKDDSNTGYCIDIHVPPVYCGKGGCTTKTCF